MAKFEAALFLSLNLAKQLKVAFIFGLCVRNSMKDFKNDFVSLVAKSGYLLFNFIGLRMARAARLQVCPYQ